MKKRMSTDLSKLSNIPEDIVVKLLSLGNDIIGNSVYEAILSNDKLLDIDLEFGRLIIKADLKELKIKFIPAKELEEDLKSINEGNQPSLKHKLEKAVVAKLIDVYKGMI